MGVRVDAGLGRLLRMSSMCLLRKVGMHGGSPVGRPIWVGRTIWLAIWITMTESNELVRQRRRRRILVGEWAMARGILVVVGGARGNTWWVARGLLPGPSPVLRIAWVVTGKFLRICTTG